MFRAIRHGRGAQGVWHEVIHLPHEIRLNGLEMLLAIRHGRGAQGVWHQVIHLPHEIRSNGLEMPRAIRHGRGGRMARGDSPPARDSFKWT